MACTKPLPSAFLDKNGRRVLSDEGYPGMDGIRGLGSRSEMMKCEIAALIYRYGDHLDADELAEIEHWVEIMRKPVRYVHK